MIHSKKYILRLKVYTVSKKLKVIVHTICHVSLILSFLSSLPPSLPSSLPSSLPPSLPSFLPSFLPPFLPPFLPFFLPNSGLWLSGQVLYHKATSWHVISFFKILNRIQNKWVKVYTLKIPVLNCPQN
jgi:hypothetical protein